MPATAALHRAQVFATPWSGVFGTWIESGRSFGRHWHEVFGLGLVLQGAQASASGRGPVEAFAGDLITSNPGELHDGRPLGGDARRWAMLYLEPALLPDQALTQPVIRDARLAQTLRLLFAQLRAWQAGGENDAARLACDETFAAALGLLGDAYSTAPLAPPTQGPVPAALRLVHERLADAAELAAPGLDELAALAGLSKYQLLRRFEQRYGLPPHAWLLQRRAERARGLIGAGSALAEAAAAAGFADQSHMTRVFTRQFGFTPGAWRRAVAGPQ
ncbi:AraC family transcriptional regulator [Roseateles sp. DAIF2]|uniref:AraC family transcriptional regulator n=1 Tax=Roseateles sp. DAIF2 TaxID=2714952 RepID=UPI0018A2BE33|nr:AraC family transcriptional regulator [Roseateles sp. DAIF2]QPF76120.1 AraC family transcriptional regulator [Roseateles sp. DAIF2]